MQHKRAVFIYMYMPCHTKTRRGMKKRSHPVLLSSCHVAYLPCMQQPRGAQLALDLALHVRVGGNVEPVAGQAEQGAHIISQTFTAAKEVTSSPADTPSMAAMVSQQRLHQCNPPCHTGAIRFGCRTSACWSSRLPRITS